MKVRNGWRDVNCWHACRQAGRQDDVAYFTVPESTTESQQPYANLAAAHAIGYDRYINIGVVSQENTAKLSICASCGNHVMHDWTRPLHAWRDHLWRQPDDNICCVHIVSLMNIYVKLTNMFFVPTWLEFLGFFLTEGTWNGIGLVNFRVGHEAVHPRNWWSMTQQ